MSTTAQPPSAVDTEREIVEHIRRADAARIQAQRDVIQWGSELASARKAKTDAVAEQIREVDGADQRATAADKAMELAARRQAEAEQRRDVGLALAKQLQGRLAQVRTFCLDELAEAMQPLVDQYEDVQHELEPLLSKLSGIHEAIHRRCRELEVGCISRVTEMDSQRGQRRSDSKMTAEAEAPANPLSPAVINMVINGSPLPLVLRPDYEPDRPAAAYNDVPVDDGGFDPIFPGDPRHQKSAGPSPSEIRQANAASVAGRGSL